MTDRDQLIEQAAQAIFIRQLRDRQVVTITYLDWEADAWRNEPADGQAEYRADARALAEAGLLAEPEQRAELEEAQRSAKFWQRQAEYWEREHQDTVLPYTAKLEAERDALQARVDAARRWLDDPQDLTPAGQLYQIRAALQGDQPAEPCALFSRTIPEHVATEHHPKWTELVCLRPHQRGHGPWKALVYHTGTALELDHLDKFLTRHAHGPAAVEPTVTPPDPSGRITDHGPVVPFEEGA